MDISNKCVLTRNDDVFPNHTPAELYLQEGQAADFERTTHNNMTRTAVDSLSMPPYAYVYLLGSIIVQNAVLEGFW
jgi:hypothetical protein